MIPKTKCDNCGKKIPKMKYSYTLTPKFLGKRLVKKPNTMGYCPHCTKLNYDFEVNN